MLPRREETSLYRDHWVDGAGPLESPVVFVGQAPGRLEALRGEPFVGRAGSLLRRAAEEAGFVWEQVRRTNVLRCQPPGNRAPTVAEIREYLPWLMEELAQMPNLALIVTLGNEAYYVFSGRSGISQRRGEAFRWRDVLVVPTLHPAYCLRNPSSYPLLVQDLRKAHRLLHAPEPVDPPRAVTVLTPGYVVIPPERILAVDTETWEDGRLRLVGIGTDTEAWVGTPEQVLPVLQRPDVTWVGHNIFIDDLWLRRAGFPLASPHREDTMLLAHLLDENRPVSLKSLVDTACLVWDRYWDGIDLRRRDSIAHETFARYCAHDAIATARLYRHLMAQTPEPLQRLYRHLLLPLASTMLSATEHGVLLDRAYAEERCAAWEAEARTIAANLPINPGSSRQVAWLLYEREGLRPPAQTEKLGHGATDERSLRMLAHPLADRILSWRHLMKRVGLVRGWLQRADAQSRIQPEYNLTGTVTGRLSSRNPNAQNLPTDPQVRGMIVAPEGATLVWADYSTIELGVAAWLYQESRMLEAYCAGRDLHAETATAILGRPPVDREERKRYGKTPNFGLLYMQGAEGFRLYAERLGVRFSAEESSRIHTLWHRTYPGVRQGWAAYHREVLQTGCVRSPSGRVRRLPWVDHLDTRQEALRQAVNFPVQATAAEFTHVAAILLRQALPYAALVLHVHDSLVFEVPVHLAERAAATIEGVMRFEVPRYCATRLGFHVPIPLYVETHTGRRWA